MEADLVVVGYGAAGGAAAVAAIQAGASVIVLERAPAGGGSSRNSGGSIALGGGDTQTAVATGVGGMQPPGTGVMPRPVTGTPHFGATDSKPVEQVRQLVQCGGTMYAVGSFSRILQRGRVFKRHNVFSFRATSPFTVRFTMRMPLPWEVFQPMPGSLAIQAICPFTVRCLSTVESMITIEL